MKNILFFICFLFSTGKVSAQVPTLHVLDTLGKDHLLRSLVDTNKNQLLVFWGAWSINSKGLLDAWKPYSQNWIDHYNIEILCVSMFSDSSQIPIAKNLWQDRGWIGKLYFANTTEVTNIGIEAVPWIILVNTEDSTIYTHAGYVSGDAVEFNQFIVGNLPLGINHPDLDNPSISIAHNNHILNFGSQNSLKGSIVSLYSIDGKLAGIHHINQNTTTYETPESLLANKHGLYVVHFKQNTLSKSVLIYLD